MLKRTLAAVAGLALSLSVTAIHAAETLRVSAIPDEAPTELIRKFKPLGERFPEEADPQVNYDPVSESWTVVLSLVFPEAASLRTVVLRPTEG